MRRISLATVTGAGAAALAAVALGAVPATAAATTTGTGALAGSATRTPVCATSQLAARLGGGDAGAGNLYRYLVITNHSRTTCHVTGFPGLSLLDAKGRQIGPRPPASTSRTHQSCCERGRPRVTPSTPSTTRAPA